MIMAATTLVQRTVVGSVGHWERGNIMFLGGHVEIVLLFAVFGTGLAFLCTDGRCTSGTVFGTGLVFLCTDGRCGHGRLCGTAEEREDVLLRMRPRTGRRACFPTTDGRTLCGSRPGES